MEVFFAPYVLSNIGISKDSPICQRLGIITYLFNLIIQLWNSLKHRSTITLILIINCHWANILIMKKVRQQKEKDFLIICNLLWNAGAYWSFSNLLKDLILIMKMLFMTNYKHRLHIKLNHSNSMWHYEQKDSLKSTHTKNWVALVPERFCNQVPIIYFFHKSDILTDIQTFVLHFLVQLNTSKIIFPLIALVNGINLSKTLVALKVIM